MSVMPALRYAQFFKLTPRFNGTVIAGQTLNIVPVNADIPQQVIVILKQHAVGSLVPAVLMHGLQLISNPLPKACYQGRLVFGVK